MIIDCHGHYTTAPKALNDYRQRQKALLNAPGAPALAPDVRIGDDEIRDSLERNQLARQRQRGVDMTVFSPPGRRNGPPCGQPADQPALDAGLQ